LGEFNKNNREIYSIRNLNMIHYRVWESKQNSYYNLKVIAILKGYYKGGD